MQNFPGVLIRHVRRQDGASEFDVRTMFIGRRGRKMKCEKLHLNPCRIGQLVSMVATGAKSKRMMWCSTATPMTIPMPL